MELHGGWIPDTGAFRVPGINESSFKKTAVPFRGSCSPCSKGRTDGNGTGKSEGGK